MDSFVPPSAVRIGVIGLGYVGLPLALAFSKHHPVIAYDINTERINSLSSGLDNTGEVSSEDLIAARQIEFTDRDEQLKECNIFIVAVPTPVDGSQRPNLAPLLSASKTVGRCISIGDVVIYESTVYPGATEEDCIPELEEKSGLKFNQDFFVGYSPERVVPGDKERPLSKIVKVTSGSTPKAADFIDGLYGAIIEAGTWKASSIKVAEAAKIIENTQRDVNIALINELSIVFSHLGIDTNEVLDAAATKWNFLRLRPGLVGGHCIGVDPYYLMHKATTAGFIPDIIRTAREINDGMARNAVGRLVKAMVARELAIKGARVLIVGFTFKENCPDIRNTKAADLLAQLSEWGIEAEVVDTWADPEEVHGEYGISIGNALPETGAYDAVILAMPHQEVVAQGAARLRTLLKPGGVLFDMKAAFAIADSDLRL
jgi:UDP-N-acetyl-D-galactosamine dehydrogenase